MFGAHVALQLCWGCAFTVAYPWSIEGSSPSIGLAHHLWNKYPWIQQIILKSLNTNSLVKQQHKGTLDDKSTRNRTFLKQQLNQMRCLQRSVNISQNEGPKEVSAS